MRLRGMLVLGALTIGAMACGDSLAPPASGARDLEFTMPTVRSGAQASTAYRTWDEAVSEAEIAKLRGGAEASLSDTEGDDEMFLPMIWSRYAAGEFVDEDYRIQFGMFGSGSGYEMIPRVKVFGPAGQVILEETGAGRAEDAPIYWYMRPHVEDAFRLGTSCGSVAELKVKYEVHMNVIGLPFGRTQAEERRTDYQRGCPPPSIPVDGGVSTQTTYDGLFICYYEVWVDQYGRIVEVYFIGCQQLSGPILMV